MATSQNLARESALNVSELKRHKVKRAHLLLLPAYLWLGLFFLLPLLIIVYYSLTVRTPMGGSEAVLTFEHYARLWDPLYARILWRSLWLALATTAITIIMAYPFAYALARAPKRWKNLLLLLSVIPFWTNFLIRTYAWMVILRSNGLINTTLMSLELIEFPLSLLYTPGSVLLGLVYGYLPFMILPIYVAIDRVEPGLLEASSDLGARPWQTFLRVTLPLTLPGIAAGILLVFVPTLGMFVIPDLMGGAKVSLVGNLIQNQFLGARNWQFGSAASVVLMALVVVGLRLYKRFFRMEGVF